MALYDGYNAAGQNYMTSPGKNLYPGEKNWDPMGIKEFIPRPPSPPPESPLVDSFAWYQDYLGQQQANARRLVGAFDDWLPEHKKNFMAAAEGNLETQGQKRGSADTRSLLNRGLFGMPEFMKGKKLRDVDYEKTERANYQKQWTGIEGRARGQLAQAIGPASGAYGAGMGAAAMQDQFTMQNTWNDYLSERNDYWNKEYADLNSKGPWG